MTLDLDAERYKGLRLAAFELDRSKAEILRTLVDEYLNDDKLRRRVDKRVEAGEFERKKGPKAEG